MSNQSVLLVIDVQVDVMAECRNSPAVIERIIELVDRARAANVPVVWVQHNDDFLERDSAGWHIVPELDPRQDEPRIFKTFSDSFSGTELEAVLGGLGAKRLILCGAQSDFCIRNTWHSALLRGFDTVLVSDAHTTADAEWGESQISADTIVAFTNMYAQFGSEYPNGRGATVSTAELSFD